MQIFQRRICVCFNCFNKMSEDAVLIDVIQHFPYLYDKSLPDYKNNAKKENAWKSIADAMQQTVEECQCIWRNLRERFAKERKLIKGDASGSAPREFEWSLYKNMTFMEKHIATRKRISNIKNVSQKSASVTKESLTTSVPLISPSGSSSCTVWSSCNTILRSDEDTRQGFESEPCAEASQESIAETPAETCSTPQRESIKRSRPQSKDIRKKSKVEAKNVPPAVEEVLGNIGTYLKQRNISSDKNLAFGQYVGLTLSEMPLAEQNRKKLQIVEILNKEFND